ncbi:hypothetical protein RND81_02G118900 [Saponaria officinalis]|uniref:Reverse transcriptase zinc-binding domain-containing protein n=1 Tax=Saponaria officinalis TaxID=3572 RepID=A0AAW1MSV6_SAPOF
MNQCSSSEVYYGLCSGLVRGCGYTLWSPSVARCTVIAQRVWPGLRHIGSGYTLYIVPWRQWLYDPHRWRQWLYAPSARGIVTSIAKYIWWLANKKGHLWVKWVNRVYLKGQSWSVCRLSTAATWSSKRICKVRDIMLPGFHGDWWLQEGNDYTVNQGFCIPKHSFICWLHAHLRLQTKAGIYRYGYGGDMLCCLCADSEESISHLFFECPYSSYCLQLASSRLGLSIPRSDVWTWWTQFSFQLLFHKKVIGAFICALIYQVWITRNHSFHNAELLRLEIWLKTMFSDVIFRCKYLSSCNVRSSVLSWLNDL